MYGKDEQAFLDLKERFREELKEIDKQIDALEVRQHELMTILYGENVVAEDAEVENKFPEREPFDKDQVDGALVGFIERNPGSNRRQIDYLFEDWGLSKTDIDNAIKRCRQRGLIVVEGRSRAASWYPVEQ